MSRDLPDVVVGKLDPPRFQRYERSGGLAVEIGCSKGSHVWFTMRGVPIKNGAKCACGKTRYVAERAEEAE